MTDDAIATRPTSALDTLLLPTPKLATALAKAAADFPDIKKDAKVSMGAFDFKYATLGAIYKAVRPALSENGLSIVHLVDGPTLVTILQHSSGESISSAIPIGQPKEWKEYGSALTYARRYAVSGLLGVAADDDTDASMLDDRGPSTAEPARRRKPRHPVVRPADASGIRLAIVKLMDKHALTNQERSQMWADYASDHAGLLSHLTGMGDGKAEDPIPF